MEIDSPALGKSLHGIKDSIMLGKALKTVQRHRARRMNENFRSPSLTHLGYDFFQNIVFQRQDIQFSRISKEGQIVDRLPVYDISQCFGRLYSPTVNLQYLVLGGNQGASKTSG